MIIALTIFLSAFLLFTVQLILGKWLLPWFGGVPAVWTTSMLFFQLLLLAGYGYARLLDHYLDPPLQARVHGGLLLLAALTLGLQWYGWGVPLLPDAAWRPDPESIPWLHLLGTLTLAVGVPFLLLAATSPLLQRWYSLLASGNSPYRLYALSNVGSLLGLLAYPFLIEVALAVPEQAWVWTLLFAVMIGGCGAAAWRMVGIEAPPPGAAMVVADSAGQAPGRPAEWLLLSAAAVAMLLAVTNLLSQDIAVVPLLWVVPLALYLVTFILCFDHPRWYRQSLFVALLALLVVAVSVVLTSPAKPGLLEQLLLYGSLLFVFCMLCHGELYRSRPEVSRLTSFYLMVATGGALGGAFVSLVAPWLFKGFWEFPVVLLAGCAMLLLRWQQQGLLAQGHWRHAAVVSGILLAFVAAGTINVHAAAPGGGLRLLLLVAATFACTHLACFALAKLGTGSVLKLRVWGLGEHACVLFLAAAILSVQVLATFKDTLWVARNFYGVVRVIEVAGQPSAPAYREMLHGQVQHGFQFVDSDWRSFPTSYYSPDGGAGLALTHHPRGGASDAALSVGVIGLGIGTLAAYGRPQDRYVQYEINPLVSRLALGAGGWFSYLEDSPALQEIVGGDARIAMEAHLAAHGGRGFDVLVLDAFSGDAVPAHLLTVEAFDLYRAHLADTDAVIAAHVSNLFLDLPRVVRGAAQRLGLEAITVTAGGSGPRPFASDWVILFAPENSWIRSSPIMDAVSLDPDGEPELWTDRYSSLFRIMRTQPRI
ncbi:MAG: hypothetical protein JJT88_12940 [Gammaproteobacteria bacterium]|nr:hypothetical protein [Gammaproteobacteria bacterium]